MKFMMEKKRKRSSSLSSSSSSSAPPKPLANKKKVGEGKTGKEERTKKKQRKEDLDFLTRSAHNRLSCDEGISTEIGAGRFSDNESKSGVTGPGTSSDLGDNEKEPNDD